jgi:uncharacterized protein YcbK (DUF882 family)
VRYWTPQHFKPEELLPPEVLSNLLRQKLDPLIVFDARILWTLDAIRERFDQPITVNNWKSGGPYSQRGFRTSTDGAKYSQHRFGRAVDFDILGFTATRFREMARTHELDACLQYITRIEDNTNWIHIDCASIPGTSIEFFTKKG